jgi:hypothetical protein
MSMSDVPDWMDALVRTVSDAMTAHGMPGPVGLRYREEDETWDLLVYPLPLELVGGKHDGDVVAPAFTLDLEQVRTAFTRVDEVSWQAHSLGEHDDGPYVSIEGEYAGRQVWLRVLAYAPDGEEAGERFDTNRR